MWTIHVRSGSRYIYNDVTTGRPQPRSSTSLPQCAPWQSHKNLTNMGGSVMSLSLCNLLIRPGTAACWETITDLLAYGIKSQSVIIHILIGSGVNHSVPWQSGQYMLSLMLIFFFLLIMSALHNFYYWKGIRTIF